MKPFVAIHAGAGYHSSEKRKVLAKFLNELCTNSIEQLRNGGDALDVLESIIKALEVSDSTNAGIAGSNFTLCGVIEADACIAGVDCGASIGAVPMTGTTEIIASDIHPYPISIARALWERQGPGLAGRQTPSFLTGYHAHEFAKDCGFEMLNQTDAQTLITNRQIETYHNHLRVLGNAISSKKNDVLNDTVGAIVIDQTGKLLAGASSGGISLKHRGRIGPAAIPGVGVVVDELKSKSVAICLSGTGEQIIKTFIGRKITNLMLNSNLPQNELKTFIMENFIESRALSSENEKSLGAIVLTKDMGGIDFTILHTTPSFCVASIGGDEKKPIFKLSRLAKNQICSVQCRFVPFD